LKRRKKGNDSHRIGGEKKRKENGFQPTSDYLARSRKEGGESAFVPVCAKDWDFLHGLAREGKGSLRDTEG